LLSDKFLRNRRGSGSLYWNILKDKQTEEFTKLSDKLKTRIVSYCMPLPVAAGTSRDMRTAGSL
jgi:hypothetical protein